MSVGFHRRHHFSMEQWAVAATQLRRQRAAAAVQGLAGGSLGMFNEEDEEDEPECVDEDESNLMPIEQLCSIEEFNAQLAKVGVLFLASKLQSFQLI